MFIVVPPVAVADTIVGEAIVVDVEVDEGADAVEVIVEVVAEVTVVAVVTVDVVVTC
jgi:hypothetical protein